MEVFMEFGTWVQNVRKERGIDIRAIAEKTGVDASTISRIENSRTEATLYTSFRICQGLRISLSELVQLLSGPYPLALEEREPSEEETVVTFHDVEDFVGSFRSAKRKYCGRIAESLTFIST